MEEDERREVAIVSNPNLKNSSGVTNDQLAKFRELQRRRLQIKTKSKKKNANVKGKLLDEALNESINQRSNNPKDNSGSSKTNENTEVRSSSPQVEVHPALKKRKLHWGLDSKERWERKANM